MGEMKMKKNHFLKKNYIGKVNYINLKLTKELNEKICQDNCELCETNNINICVTCKYSSNIENNKKICLNKPNDDVNTKPII